MICRVRVHVPLLSIACFALHLLFFFSEFPFSRSCPTGVKPDEPGHFDFYLVVFDWRAEFCTTSRFKNSLSCQKPDEHHKTSLTLRGLWPNFRHGIGPHCCAPHKHKHVLSVTRPHCFDQIRHKLSFLQKYWPSDQIPSPAPKDVKLHNSAWDHAWTKHGTCSGLEFSPYFDLALKFAKDLDLVAPQSLISKIGQEVARGELEAIYNEGNPCGEDKECLVRIVCEGKYLSGIQICFDKSANVDKSAKRVVCPPSSSSTKCSEVLLNVREFK